MSFSTLPNELVQEILIAAVRLRVTTISDDTPYAVTKHSVERALRLRLVSRLWDTITMYAIFQSGILNDPWLRPFPYICRPFWSQYLVDKIMYTTKPLTRPFLVIRQVAKRILAFRGEDTWGKKLEECIFEISKVCMNTRDRRGGYRTWMTPPARTLRNPNMSTEITDHDEDFMQALLAAAAFTNEVKLVKELLPRFRQLSHLIYPNKSLDRPLLGYPLQGAAFKGNVEIAHIFLDFIIQANEGQGSPEVASRNVVILHGSKNNNIAMIELGLDPLRWNKDSEPYLLNSLSLATSVDAFKRLHELYEDCIINDMDYIMDDEEFIDDEENFIDDEEFLLDNKCIIEYRKRPKYTNCLTKLSVLLKLICRFATAGNIPLIEHVIQLCGQLGLSVEDMNESRKYKLCGPLGGPARYGHLSTVVYLLEKGFKADENSIYEAARHGNIRIMRLLLENVIYYTVDWSHALYQAVSGENESVFRLLVESGVTLYVGIESEGLRIAEEEGLESMANLIKEYEWEIQRLRFIEDVE
ncbi:hypothetical protein F5Y00DRAFT_226652 [Daldinia vernicosa]|uniref:uncharacterized protein n=1 Tax=Daldinia vernicosa TaxID=114800 RepID=UPI002007785D|nr:uncharacterized protein F5Y00DRAFT_226652 [Daldinia vernicosa]KAI0852455.1 hypothetical protein F5Y00DRAFT_226652 [Daldinia vernicosa]